MLLLTFSLLIAAGSIIGYPQGNENNNGGFNLSQFMGSFSIPNFGFNDYLGNQENVADNDAQVEARSFAGASAGGDEVGSMAMSTASVDADGDITASAIAGTAAVDDGDEETVQLQSVSGSSVQIDDDGVAVDTFAASEVTEADGDHVTAFSAASVNADDDSVVTETFSYSGATAGNNNYENGEVSADAFSFAEAGFNGGVPPVFDG